MFTSNKIMKSKYRVQSCIFDLLLSGLGGSQVKYQEEEAEEEEEDEEEEEEEEEEEDIAQRKNKKKKE